jgi:hypothetical protein
MRSKSGTVRTIEAEHHVVRRDAGTPHLELHPIR